LFKGLVSESDASPFLGISRTNDRDSNISGYEVAQIKRFVRLHEENPIDTPKTHRHNPTAEDKKSLEISMISREI
jgi:hypothetical protein